MARCLNDSLRLVAPHVPPALVSPGIVGRVQRLARHLAPIHCGGFECRLDSDPRVDFQQRILNREQELLILHHHIVSSDLAHRDPWCRLAQLSEELLDERSFLARSLSVLWLEFDLRGRFRRGATPSLFLTLREEQVGASNFDRLRQLLDDTTALLFGRAVPAPVEANVHRIMEALPPSTGIHHLGFMMGRDVEGFRLVIRGFTPVALKKLLRNLPWEGNLQRLEQELSGLPELVNRLVVSLDVGARIGAPVGLEFFPGMHPDLEPRWSALLDFLVASELCLPGKAHALLSFPGHSEPASDGAPWPAHLLFDSLLAPPHQFPALGRRLSHIKMTCGTTAPMAVKAYFGFGPLRLEYPTRRTTPHGDEPRPWAVRRETPLELPPKELTSAIDAGISYLLRHRDEAGWWREFAVQAGSDEWTTAYVGANLAELGDGCDRARGAARGAWTLLAKRRHASGGWGFNGLCPKDADSTSWALRLAQTLGVADHERAKQAHAFLLRHIQPDGGVATFLESTRIRLLSRLPLGAGVEGWCSSHPDVTAAAAAIPGVAETACRYLRATQRADGSWKGYWIGGREYTTALAVEALARAGEPTDPAVIRRAVRWAAQRVGPDGSVRSRAHRGKSAFATALAVRILISTEAMEEVGDLLLRAVRWLLGCQRPDGSWPPSFRFRHPPAHVIHPERESYECINLDEGSTFTTVTVLAALARLSRSALVRPGGGYSRLAASSNPGDVHGAAHRH